MPEKFSISGTWLYDKIMEKIHPALTSKNVSKADGGAKSVASKESEIFLKDCAESFALFEELSAKILASLGMKAKGKKRVREEKNSKEEDASALDDLDSKIAEL